MEKMKLEIIVRSATGLPNVRRSGKMRVFSRVFLSARPFTTMQKTQVDKFGETNPVWNSNMTFSLSQSDLQRSQDLIFTLISERTLGDKTFGVVRVPLASLRATAPSGNYTEVSCPIGTAKLNFSYRFKHEGLLADLVVVLDNHSNNIGSTRDVVNDGGSTSAAVSGGLIGEESRSLKAAKIMKELAQEGLERTVSAVHSTEFVNAINANAAYQIPDVGGLDFSGATDVAASASSAFTVPVVGGDLDVSSIAEVIAGLLG